MSKAKDCTPPEKYLESHYMGYLAATEREKQPFLVWWRDEHNNDALEIDPSFFGVKKLSEIRIFKEAREVLRRKKADTYLLVWPDAIYLSGEEAHRSGDKTEVIKVSLGYSKNFPAYVVAYETIYEQRKVGENETVSVPISYDLGCAGNLLK